MFSTTWHSQTDGQTEVVNKSLSTFLKVILKGNNKSWDEYFAHIEFAYNWVVYKTSNFSPFEVFFMVLTLSLLLIASTLRYNLFIS